jgi:hypothetical protein
LRLVAAGEEGELLRVGPADVPEALGGDGERFLPFDLAKLAGAPRSAAQHGLSQPRRAVMLHDAGAALAAEHAAIDRVVLVAADVADLAVAYVHVDAAAAGAHVAGRLGDPVGDMRRGLDPVRLGGSMRMFKGLLGKSGVCSANVAHAHPATMAPSF